MGSKNNYKSENPVIIPSLTLPDPTVLVLAEGETDSAVNNNRGHLFEDFIAHLFHLYGYNRPTRIRLNQTSNGIELDVSAVHELNGQPASAECKAYASPVKVEPLGFFHSKFTVEAYGNPSLQGFFIAIPRLTSNAAEYARAITSNDEKFKVITANGIVELLKGRKTIVDCPLPNVQGSDSAVLITVDGIYASCHDLDPVTRTTAKVLVWAAVGPVPLRVIEMLSRHSYSRSSPVLDARGSEKTKFASPYTEPPVNIVTVTGSKSDFDYQLPASPKYFVGRKALVKSMAHALDTHTGVVILNAQSGWGKSSAALRLQELARERKGYALIVDSRTATDREFVTEALKNAANDAERNRVLRLPSSTSWASLASSLRTLADSAWVAGPLVIFFDQFENVFRNKALTEEFRDLALSAKDLSDHLLIGFAWKTDLIGLIDDHPYNLQEEIRGYATVLPVPPLGPFEVSTLIRRMERELQQPLSKDLATRLREYSQGLPWLFKKLAVHVLREVEAGANQAQLASEALNVQGLFDADLAQLGPVEQQALRDIAKYAPISIGELAESVNPDVLQILIHRRLIVQVGEKYDTYWDIFRDYLNDGRIPVEDSYILRLSPNSVARLLQEVQADAGNSSVREVASRLGTSENAVFNLSRELRVLGATVNLPNRIKLIIDIWDSQDREEQLRNCVAAALRRHRAYSTFASIAHRGGTVTVESYARVLPAEFPAIAAKQSTWLVYARVFLQWFEYAGLAAQSNTRWILAPEGYPGEGQLFGRKLVRKQKHGFLHDLPGPAVKLLIELTGGPIKSDRVNKRAIRTLEVIDCAALSDDGFYRTTQPGVVNEGKIDSGRLHELLMHIDGVAEGLSVIRAKPSASPREVGQAVKIAVHADWSEASIASIGVHLRSWARMAGLTVQPVPRKLPESDRMTLPGL